ncbi:MAG: CBS domain-containing protein [Phaeodactylibacter sp.]|nr:CBS domain-containing protein [Phaeodactylibacter sp.]MCB9273203.1 CBS domain-containing protein [Lewinellaceae bacterium]
MIKVQSIPVSEVMSRDLLIIRKDEMLGRVNEIFRAYNIHHLPVVDAHGQLCGIISKADQLRANHLIGLYNQAFHEEVTAQDIMTRQVATIGPDEPLQKAADVFLSNIFHALPVVDRGQLIGIITTHDLLRFSYSEELLLDD